MRAWHGPHQLRSTVAELKGCRRLGRREKCGRRGSSSTSPPDCGVGTFPFAGGPPPSLNHRDRPPSSLPTRSFHTHLCRSYPPVSLSSNSPPIRAVFTATLYSTMVRGELVPASASPSQIQSVIHGEYKAVACSISFARLLRCVAFILLSQRALPHIMNSKFVTAACVGSSVLGDQGLGEWMEARVTRDVIPLVMPS